MSINFQNSVKRACSQLFATLTRLDTNSPGVYRTPLAVWAVRASNTVVNLRVRLQGSGTDPVTVVDFDALSARVGVLVAEGTGEDVRIRVASVTVGAGWRATQPRTAIRGTFFRRRKVK